MVFIHIYLKEADGGFIVGCPDENVDHIFTKYSDAICFIDDYFAKNKSDNPDDYEFADAPEGKK